MNDNELIFLDKLHLISRNVYGRVLIYPGCMTSRTLVKLTRRLTFDERDLEVLRELGFHILVTAGV